MNYIESVNSTGKNMATWINQIQIRSYTPVSSGLVIHYGNKTCDVARFAINGINDPFFKAVRYEYYNPSKFRTKAALLAWLKDLHQTKKEKS